MKNNQAIPFNKDYLYCEDYEWWTKIILADIKVGYSPKSLVKYRTHKKNMTDNILKITTSRINNIKYLDILQKYFEAFLTFYQNKLIS